MTEHNRILDSFSICITDICKGCQWTECMEADSLVEVPESLALAVIDELTAQEPRLLTKADFESNPALDYRGALPVWIEHRFPITYGGDGYWGSWTSDDFDIYDTIRPWTARPDTKQIESTPW